MSPGRRVPEWLSVYLKGVAMGTADAIPGVSGGTIALITGIYDRLIRAIAGLSEDGPGLLRDVVRPDGPGLAAAWGRLRGMDVPFLAVLGLGVLTGVATLANLAHYALVERPALTFAFFFGIILASPVVLRREVSLRSPRGVASGVAGFVVAFAVGGLPHARIEYALPALFLIGAVAISAMVLPGISGSLILVIIGAYDTMTGAVSDLTRAALEPSPAAAAEPFAVLAVFATGALVGVVTFARAVSWALGAHRAATMTFLVGVMLGALHTPARRIAANVSAVTPAVAGALLAAGIAGALVVLALEYATDGYAGDY